MTQIAKKESGRMSLRMSQSDKAVIMRAAELEQSPNLTAFVTQHIVQVAREVISKHETLQLSEGDSLCVLDLLDNPPPPNEKLMRAALSLSQLDER